MNCEQAIELVRGCSPEKLKAAIKKSEDHDWSELTEAERSLVTAYGWSPELSSVGDARIAAAALGRSKSPAKTAAARANGAKGGRPRKWVSYLLQWEGPDGGSADKYSSLRYAKADAKQFLASGKATKAGIYGYRPDGTEDGIWSND